MDRRSFKSQFSFNAKRFKIIYTEDITKTSIVFAENEKEAYQKFKDNEDYHRETKCSSRDIIRIELLKGGKKQ